MRWLLIADTHAEPEHDERVRARMVEVDGLIHVGDWTWFGARGRGQMDVWKEFLLAGKQVLYVPGNHEGRWGIVKGQERANPDWVEPPAGAIDLSCGIHVAGQAVFFGPDLYKRDSLDPFAEVNEIATRHKIETRVLVTHYPPTNRTLSRPIDDGDDLALDVLQRTRPHICICGHIHLDRPVEETLVFPAADGGEPIQVRMVNPGPWGMEVEL